MKYITKKYLKIYNLYQKIGNILVMKLLFLDILIELDQKIN